MLSIEIHLLTGRYVASQSGERDQAEWPPHPARLFSALVDVWGDDENDADGLAALEWLETLPAPVISASRASERHVVTHFVPVNDATIVQSAAYRNKTKRIGDALTLLAAAENGPAGEKQRTRAVKALNKERDATNLTALPGNTNPLSAWQLLPDGRLKQSRNFPSVTPLEPFVCFSWPQANPSNHLEALDRLLAGLHRLGHSSSLVSGRIISSAPSSNWIPIEAMHRTSRGQTLRWVGPGQVAHLRQTYALHQASEPRAILAKSVYYQNHEVATAKPGLHEIVPSIQPQWISFALPKGQRILPITRAVDLAKAVRGALISHADDESGDARNEVLTGHQPNGAPSLLPHMSVISLPDVGHKHASGQIKGFAILIPGDADPRGQKAILRAIGHWERKAGNRLTMGKLGQFYPKRQTATPLLHALRASTWTKASTTWATATPIALPRSPGSLTGVSPAKLEKAWQRARESVAYSCELVGLPAPVDITVGKDPILDGCESSHRFPSFAQGESGLRRSLVHARLTFDRPITGPLVLGSGRFRGLGLMRPLPEGKSR